MAGKSDKELADGVRRKAEELKAVIQEAYNAGLEVHLLYTPGEVLIENIRGHTVENAPKLEAVIKRQV